MADDEQPPAAPPVREAGPSGTGGTLSAAHRRRVWRVILVSQLVVALVTGLVVVLAYRQLNSDIPVIPGIPDEVRRPAKPKVEGPREPLNILVMGSDNRKGKGNNIDGLTGGGQRSDTTLLLHVSADRQTAYGVSLPRDALVDRPMCVTSDGKRIPGEHLAMFNEAFSLGGPTCTVQTVEKLTRIRIDHYLVVDFRGFEDMVEAVGGVEVCIPKDVEDPAHDIFLEAGTQTLTGREALNYVRERTVLSSTGDIGRMRRQQAFIGSMIKKVVSAGTLSRPTRVYGFLKAATKSISVDEDLGDLAKMADLALQLRRTGLDDIKFITVPFKPYPPDPNRLVWTPRAELLWQRIRRDEPLGREFSKDSLSAADPVGTPGGKGGGKGSGGTSPEEAQRLANGLCP